MTVPARCNRVIVWGIILIVSVPIWCQAQAHGPYSRRTPIVEAFDRNKDAVVAIQGKQEVPDRNDIYSRMFEDWPFFRPRNLPPSLGSGFLIDSRGYIMTNAHVVQDTSEITIILADNSEKQARLVAMDESTDLAILKIDAETPLPAVVLGRSDDLLIGETVLAIGNPFGYQHTLTDGVISAIHRKVQFDENRDPVDLIQISAPINPGNSGGPLININGEVIGINNAIRKAAEGIGFSIPIDRLRETLPKLLDVERLYRLDFGAELVDPNSFSRTGEDTKSGAMVRYVRAGSSAARAGLMVGDVVVALADRSLGSVIDFYLDLIEQPHDKPLKLKVLRLGKPAEITLSLNRRPQPDAVKLADQLLGLEVKALTPEMLRHYDRIPGKVGNVVVLAVERNGPAYAAGIKPGDVIMMAAGREIRQMEDIALALENITPGAMLRMTIYRTEKFGPMLQISQSDVTLRTRSVNGDEDSSGKMRL